MKNSSLALLAIAAVLATTPAAKADTTFNDFSFQGSGGVSGSFVLTGTYEGPGSNGPQYLIDSASGTFNDGTFSGPVSLYYPDPVNHPGVGNPNYPSSTTAGVNCPDPATCFYYDDAFNPEGGIGNYLDGAGLALDFDGNVLNIYGGGGRVWGDGWIESNGLSGDGTFWTPEPDSLLLMASGISALAAILFWKSKRLGLVLNR